MAGRIRRAWQNRYTQAVLLLVEIGVSVYVLTRAPLAMDQPSTIGVVGGLALIVLVLLFWVRKGELYYKHYKEKYNHDTPQPDSKGDVAPHAGGNVAGGVRGMHKN